MLETPPTALNDPDRRDLTPIVDAIGSRIVVTTGTESDLGDSSSVHQERV